jgi:hypothetical protein
MSLNPFLSGAVLAGVLVLLAGGKRAAAAAEIVRCGVLTRAEIEQAIGPHDGGKNELTNEWGIQSCRWTAAAAKPGAPPGWRDAIEVAVFDDAMTSWARQQIKGIPVTGFAKTAAYDRSYGELWFDCATNRICVVKVRTATGGGREETATRLAHLVEGRVR